MWKPLAVLLSLSCIFFVYQAIQNGVDERARERDQAAQNLRQREAQMEEERTREEAANADAAAREREAAEKAAALAAETPKQRRARERAEREEARRVAAEERRAAEQARREEEEDSRRERNRREVLSAAGDVWMENYKAAFDACKPDYGGDNDAMLRCVKMRMKAN